MYARLAKPIPATSPRAIAFFDWKAEGVALFGSDFNRWRFVCPSCNAVHAVEEWLAFPAGAESVARACLETLLPSTADESGGFDSRCKWTLDEGHTLNPVTLTQAGKDVRVFRFADPETAAS